jgi:hypothetical protein
VTDIIETRVQKLADDVERLKTIVADLARRVDAVTSAPFGTATSPANAPVSSAVASQPQDDMSEELLGWVGRASLLQRISAISFLLVIALSLRTITDKGILSPVV